MAMQFGEMGLFVVQENVFNFITSKLKMPVKPKKKISCKKISKKKIDVVKEPTLKKLKNKLIDLYKKSNKTDLAIKTGQVVLGAYLINEYLLKDIEIQKELSIIKREILKANPIFKKIIGETFENQYQVKNMLGEGTFGKVSIAIDKESGKDVIIKSIILS